MIYRKLGKTGFEASLLGMGCMRLPWNDENDVSRGVNREKAYELIRFAVDSGINYFDTAQGYHSGDSEAILGEALDCGRGLREKVWITTKHPFWGEVTPEKIRQNLEATLKKLRTDYLDTYLMHGIGHGNWENIKKWNIWGEFEKFRNEGLIKTIGFSYHGDYKHFKEVAAYYPWELTLVMHNMLDTDREVTAAGIEAAAGNMAVTIMEPLRGGGLCHAPRGVAEIYDAAPTKRTPTEWAFRYLADMPGCESIVSGMSTMEQLKENLAIFSNPDLQPGCLTPDEREIITNARAAYKAITAIPCPGCNYCLPCPQGVGISNVFNIYNDGNRFEFFDQAKRSYMFARRGGRGADKCNACGICLTKCPHGIAIPEELKKAHATLDGWNE